MNKSDSSLITANDAASLLMSHQVRDLVTNATSYGRSELLSKLLDPRRDVDKECGYIETEKLSVADYQVMYDRESIATRVVELEPKESWRVKPCVYENEDEDTETEFEKAFNELCLNFTKKTWLKPQEETHPIWDIMARVDILSGVGHFGLMLLNIDDGKEFSEPIEGFGSTDNTPVTNEDLKELRDQKPVAKRSLLSVSVFEESLIQINQYETEKANPRYGWPVMYTLTMNDPKNNHQSGIGITTQTERVHWSRVVHIADNLASSRLFGVPRQRPVWNRLMDCRKVYGSSAEGYWQGAFPGLSMETHPQLGGDVTIDAAATKSQLQSYTNTLQRYVLSSGMTVKMLSPTVVDPTAQINAYIDAICIKLGCPKRIFVGSERGELASSQDKDTWEERIEARRNDHVSANIIVPFIDRCISIGVLPEPADGYAVKWEAKDTLSPMDKATVAKTKTEAFGAYVSGGIDTLISPKNYLTKIHDIPSDEADQMLEDAIDHINEANPEADDIAVAGQKPVQPMSPEMLQPGAPIKMKDGETLVDPSGKSLNGTQPVQVGGIPVINHTLLWDKLNSIVVANEQPILQEEDDELIDEGFQKQISERALKLLASVTPFTLNNRVTNKPKRRPPINVTVNQPAINVNVPEQPTSSVVVNVPEQTYTNVVNLPELKPNVIVNVPKTKPPIVNVAAPNVDITVNPELKIERPNPVGAMVVRDTNGKIVGIEPVELTE